MSTPASGGELKAFAQKRQKQREYAEESLKLLGLLLFDGCYVIRHLKPDEFLLKETVPNEIEIIITITVTDDGFSLLFQPINKSLAAASHEELDAYLLAYYKRYRELQPERVG